MSVSEYKNQIDRTKQDPPIPGQGCALVSFLPFTEPKKTENGDTVFGFMKVRGTFAGTHINNRAAIEAAQILVREFDSMHPIQCVPVGTWIPVTSEARHVAEKIDVKMDVDSKEEIHLRDLAAKEKQAKDRAVARELKEREEQVANHDVYDNRESLEFYVMKRNVVTTLRDSEKALLAKLEDVRCKLAETVKIAKSLDESHPEYNDQWVDCYNKKRREVGIPDFVEPEVEREWYAQQA
jgi:hypothetical protein